MYLLTKAWVSANSIGVDNLLEHYGGFGDNGMGSATSVRVDNILEHYGILLNP